MENGDWEMDPMDLTVGKKGLTVEADPRRSGSLYGSGVPRKMNGWGDEGEAKKGSTNGSGVVVVSCSTALLVWTANKSDLTLGVLPSGLSSGPKNIQDCRPAANTFLGSRCNNYVLYHSLSFSIYVNTCKVRFYFFCVLFIQLRGLLRLDKFNLVLTMVVKVNLSSGFFSGFVKFLEKLFLSPRMS